MTRRPLTRGGTTRCFFSIPTTVGQVKPGALVLWTRIAWEKPGNFCRRRRPALGYRRAHGKPTTSSPRGRRQSAQTRDVFRNEYRIFPGKNRHVNPKTPLLREGQCQRIRASRFVSVSWASSQVTKRHPRASMYW